MPNTLVCHYGRGHLHFITFICYSAPTPGEVRNRYGFSLAGYVVTPEHIHLLISQASERKRFWREPNSANQ